MEDRTLTMTMLFDLYGELLTEKQRQCFDLYYNADLSLGELSETFQISRQGARDNIVRAENALLEYEAKTHLLERTLADRHRLDEAQRALETIRSLSDNEEICRLADSVLAQLTELRG